MGQGTEELTHKEAQIEATRADLSRNIDELGDKVSPSRVIERRKEAARSRLGSLRDKVMGSASSARHSAASTGSSVTGGVSSAASTVGDSASSAVETMQQKAQGNPLAAGLMAFGAGMVISALLPASEKEQQVAQRAVDAAKEHGQPLTEEAKSVGQEMGQNLKESATEAAQEVKSSAQDSVETVKEEGRSSAQTVKQEARPTS